jgi:AcrR family transcriptional regulator
MQAALDLFKERGFASTTMRDIARRAGVATGAAYYYFASKESLIFGFYEATREEMQTLVRGRAPESRDLRERLKTVLELKFEQFQPHRRLLGVLFAIAADPESPLSPFGEETRTVRERAISLFAEAVEGSDAKIAPDLLTHVPRLLWLYQMGLILFWIHDRSPGQVKTKRLLDKSLDLVVGALKLSRFRITAPLRKAALDLIAFLDAPERDWPKDG